MHIEDCGGWWLSSCHSSVAELALAAQARWFSAIAGFSLFFVSCVFSSSHVLSIWYMFYAHARHLEQ